MKSSKHFLKFFFASQILAILGVIFILVVVIWRSQNTITSVGNEFLWHPILMALSFGYLFGTSITIFRALRYIKKVHLKRLHTAIHLLAIAFGIGGLVTAFDMTNAYNGPHLRSLHGLFGIVTVIFFCIQWVISFVVFLYPQGSDDVRGLLMPYHVIVGVILYVVSSSAILTGINQYNRNSRGSLSSEGILLNFAGFFFLINSLLVGYMLLKEEYKRKPTDADN